MSKDYPSIVHSAYTKQSYDVALAAPENMQLSIESVRLVNNMADNNIMAVCNSIVPKHWEVFTVGSANVDVTADVQNELTTDVIDTSLGDGFMVCCKTKFSMLALSVAQEAIGSTLDYEYWNGSTWQPLSIVYTTDMLSLYEQGILFVAPQDWQVGSNGEGNDAYYSVRISTSIATSQVAQINGLKVCKALAIAPRVFKHGSLQLKLDGQKQLLLQQGEEILPFFAFPSSLNIIEIAYRISP